MVRMSSLRERMAERVPAAALGGCDGPFGPMPLGSTPRGALCAGHPGGGRSERGSAWVGPS
jgi:hypothetical protein